MPLWPFRERTRPAATYKDHFNPGQFSGRSKRRIYPLTGARVRDECRKPSTMRLFSKAEARAPTHVPPRAHVQCQALGINADRLRQTFGRDVLGHLHFNGDLRETILNAIAIENPQPDNTGPAAKLFERSFKNVRCNGMPGMVESACRA